MQRSPVRSASIVSAGYDDTTRVLELEYAAGNVYQYADVPREAYDWFLMARSKGSFVNRRIKDRYAYREIVSRHADGEVDLLEALQATLEKGCAGPLRQGSRTEK